MNEPPNDVEMEKFVLSAMLLKEGVAVPVVAGILSADDFYRPAHRTVYRAIVGIYERGGMPNALALIDELRRTNELERVGIELVYLLTEYANTTAYAESYARALKEKSILRSLIRVSHEIAELAYQSRPASEIVTAAEGKLIELYGGERGTGFEPLSEIVRRSVLEIGAQLEGARFTGVPSGYAALDGVTNGFQRGELILLAARPSMGKTALALNLAVNAGLSGKTVAIFSLEMSKSAIARRLLVMESRLDSTQVQTGAMTPEEYGELLSAAAELSELKIYISDGSDTSAAGLRSLARRQKLEHGVELIIIDYLQLLSGEGENRQQEISAISRSLKGLARELEVPIIALSQLSRNVEQRADKRPLLSDLRESGALEQDADVVLFLYREDYYDAGASANVAELIVAKNRNGATRRLNMYYDRRTQRFEELEG